MNDAARKTRNATILAECWPPFGAAVERVFGRLELKKWRPRGMVGHRSLAQQAQEVAEGDSKVSFGYHNCAGPPPEKKPESLAVDFVEDSYPLRAPMEFYREVALAAEAEQLETGIYFGCNRAQRAAIRAWLNGTGPEPKRNQIGWDPLHIQPKFSISLAKAGKRPDYLK